MIAVYYGDPEEFENTVSKKYKCQFENFSNYCEGYCAFLEKERGAYTDQHILFYIKDVDIPGVIGKIYTIYHEALHASWFILENAGIKITEDNHEPLAYLQGYIANEVCEIIDGWKKKK